MTQALLQQALLHARLFGYRRDPYYDSRAMLGHSRQLNFAAVTDLIKENTELKRDADTGLWHHVEKREIWRFQHTHGYFQVFWPSGRFLAQHLAQDAAWLINDKFVLSIGAGSGLGEIYLLKKCRPRLMACADHDVFARAALELNARANDVDVGDVLVTLAHPDAFKAVRDGQNNYRLYDTVLTADCFYGLMDESYRPAHIRLAAALRDLHHQGADVVIADRDYAEIERRADDPTRAACYERAREAYGLTDECLWMKTDMPVDDQALDLIGMRSSYGSYEPVTIHHWPASRAEAPLPRLDIPWWQTPTWQLAPGYV